LTQKGDSIITYSSTKNLKGEPMKIAKEFFQDTKKEQPGFVTAKAGMNAFVWNMRYPNVTAVDGTNVMWAGSGEGAKAIPGTYIVRLIEGKTIIAESTVEIKLDPRVSVSDADLKEQFDLHQKVNKKVNEAHIAINQIRKIRTQINGYIAAVKDTVAVNQMKKLTKVTLENLDKIEATLMQPKAKAPQDVLAFPIQLNDKMAGLGSNISSSESKPTRNAYVVYDDLAMKIDVEIKKIKDIINKDVQDFNAFVTKQQIPAIILEKEVK
jgi:hypothetical protein